MPFRALLLRHSAACPWNLYPPEMQIFMFFECFSSFLNANERFILKVFIFREKTLVGTSEICIETGPGKNKFDFDTKFSIFATKRI